MFNKNILIILILVLIIYFVFYYNNENNENFQNERDKFGPKDSRMKKIYGPHSSRGKYEENEIYEIGEDDGNSVYFLNGSTYKVTEENEFIPYEPKQIKYESMSIKIPSVITSKQIKSQVPLKIDNYRYKGIIANEAYKQYFILYEKEYNNYDLDDKLYNYMLVKKIDGDYQIVHTLPPRNKINEGDTVVFSYGNFQLGPLRFI